MQTRELPYGLILASLAGMIILGLITDQPLLAAIVPIAVFAMVVLQLPILFYYILIVTIPLSAEIQLTTSLGTDLPDEPMMWLMTPVVLFIMFRDRARLFQVMSQPIVVLILLAWCWSWISMLQAENPLLSLKFIIAKSWYIIPFVFGTIFLLDDGSKLRTAAYCLAIPMVVIVVASLVRHGLEGFSFSSVSEVVWPFFRNHVNYGALLVCTIPIVYFFYRARRNRYWLAALIILLIGLYFSYSRGAWLALLAAVVMQYVVKRNLAGWVIAVSLVLVTATSGWLLNNNRYLQFRPDYQTTIYHEALGEHIEATYSMKDLSSAERFYRWIAGWRMAKDHLFTGIGPNHFYPAYKSYTVESFRTYVSDNPEKSTVHNYFLLLLTEQGIPGMLLFLLTLITMFMTAQKLYNEAATPEIKGIALVIASILSMITVLIFLSDLIETDKIGPVFYICAGLLVAMGSGSYVKGVTKPVPE